MGGRFRRHVVATKATMVTVMVMVIMVVRTMVRALFLVGHMSLA